jgi:hypothetical protein
MGHAGRLQNLLSFLLFNAQERAQGSQNKVLLELSRDKGRAICTLRHQGRFEPLQMSAALSLNQLDLRMVICDTIALEHAGQLSFEEGDDQVIRLELPHIA